MTVSLCRKKMGPQGPFRQRSVKRGEPSVASGDRPNGLFGAPQRRIVTGPSFTSSTAIVAPKTPRSTGTPSAAEARAEPLVERLRLPPAARRSVKLGRLPLAVSASSVNWRDDERRAADVERGSGRSGPPRRGRSAAGRSCREPLGLGGAVAAGDAEQDAEPGPDLADDRAVDPHAGLARRADRRPSCFGTVIR